MKAGPTDIIIAFKVIGLAEDLSATEKRVAMAVLDHFNRKTGQCDPSLDTLARLLGIHKRSVIRAINSLEAKKYFGRDRHGGKFHRNSYTPLWAKFRASEASWKDRRLSTKHKVLARSDLSPCERQSCHLGGDADATQTFLSNQSQETCDAAPLRCDDEAMSLQQRSKWSGKEEERARASSNVQERFHVKDPQTSEVHRDVAERRWNEALMQRYANDVSALAGVVESIDQDLMAATTRAEMHRRGSGLAYLMTELNSRNAAFGKVMSHADARFKKEQCS